MTVQLLPSHHRCLSLYLHIHSQRLWFAAAGASISSSSSSSAESLRDSWNMIDIHSWKSIYSCCSAVWHHINPLILKSLAIHFNYSTPFIHWIQFNPFISSQSDSNHYIRCYVNSKYRIIVYKTNKCYVRNLTLLMYVWIISEMIAVMIDISSVQVKIFQLIFIDKTQYKIRW